MRMRLEKRREGIVSLTQTEIMLVLAVVIMLLLLLKHDDLSTVCAEVPDVCEELLKNDNPLASESAAAGNEISEEELDKEVSGNLARGSGDSANAGGTPSLNEILEKVAEATAQQKQSENEVQKLRDDNAELARENTLLQQDTVQEENLELAKFMGDLREENVHLRDEIVTLKKANADLHNKNLGTGISRLKNEVGFVPCWLGGGKPRYYFTFALTYYLQSDTFKIEPHNHWKNSNEEITAALNGGLRVLNDYPKNNVSRETFLKFAQQVNAAKNRLYGTECQLAVTINKKDVDLTVTNDFINGKTRFYPVGR